MAFTVNDMEYYHQQMWYSSHLEVVIISLFFMGGWWHPLWWAPGLGPIGQVHPRTTWPMEVVTISISCDSWGLILYNVASTHCSHHGFGYCFWLHVLQGQLERQSQAMDPLQAGCYLLEAWGWGYYLQWFWRFGWGWISFCLLYLQVVFCPLALSSPCLRTPVGVPPFWLMKGLRGLSHSGDWLEGVQHFLPTQGTNLGEPLSLPAPHAVPRVLLVLQGTPDRHCFLHGDLFSWNICRDWQGHA